MDYETVSSADFGQSLKGFSVNFLVRDVLSEAQFLCNVLEMQVFRASQDFAILRKGTHTFQLHSDGTFAANPLFHLIPESGPRGGGMELRLHDVDPDTAVLRARAIPDAVVLSPATDKIGHGLREAVILSPAGYAWVPSIPLG